MAATGNASAYSDILWWLATVSALLWFAAVGVLIYCYRAERASRVTARPPLVVPDGLTGPPVRPASVSLPRVAPLLGGSSRSGRLVRESAS